MTPLTRSCLLGVFLLTGSQAVLAQTYYAVQQIEEAKAQAHAKHLPIAWMSSQTNYLEPGFANEAEGSPAELTMLALRTLQGQAVIIFQNVDDDLPFMPANMIDRIETKDEGNTPPHGDHYTAPKIIYTDPDLKTFFGCTLAPDLRSDREAAINIALLHIRNDPQAQALINGTAVAAAPPVATPSVPAVAQPQPGAVSTMIAMGSSGSLFVYAAGAMLLLLAGVAFLAWRSRP